MKNYIITKQELKNYLINRTYLQQKGETILEVLEKLTCIQVDPINVVARNQELALWNRVENFKIQDLFDELYKNHNLYEYWLQLYSFIPAKFYPYLKARREIQRDWQEKYYKVSGKSIDETLAFVTKKGPTSSKDLLHIEKIPNLFSWNSTHSRTPLLEYLWDTGEVVVCKRVNNQKYYDIAKDVIPENYYNHAVTEKDSLHWLLESNFYYIGIIRRSFLSRMGYVKKLNLKELFDNMVKNDEILELKIEGVKTKYYILNKQIIEIENLKQVSLHTKLNILPPLDPLVIDRKILSDIFDFQYTWEAYVPPLKRKFGYYGMPILYRGEFIGQVELVKDKSKKLKIKNLQSTVKSKEFKSELNEVIKQMQELIR